MSSIAGTSYLSLHDYLDPRLLKNGSGITVAEEMANGKICSLCGLYSSIENLQRVYTRDFLRGMDLVVLPFLVCNSCAEVCKDFALDEVDEGHVPFDSLLKFPSPRVLPFINSPENAPYGFLANDDKQESLRTLTEKLITKFIPDALNESDQVRLQKLILLAKATDYGRNNVMFPWTREFLKIVSMDLSPKNSIEETGLSLGDVIGEDFLDSVAFGNVLASVEIIPGKDVQRFFEEFNKTARKMLSLFMEQEVTAVQQQPKTPPPSLISGAFNLLEKENGKREEIESPKQRSQSETAVSNLGRELGRIALISPTSASTEEANTESTRKRKTPDISPSTIQGSSETMEVPSPPAKKQQTPRPADKKGRLSSASRAIREAKKESANETRKATPLPPFQKKHLKLLIEARKNLFISLSDPSETPKVASLDQIGLPTEHGPEIALTYKRGPAHSYSGNPLIVSITAHRLPHPAFLEKTWEKALTVPVIITRDIPIPHVWDLEKAFRSTSYTLYPLGRLEGATENTGRLILAGGETFRPRFLNEDIVLEFFERVAECPVEFISPIGVRAFPFLKQIRIIDHKYLPQDKGPTLEAMIAMTREFVGGTTKAHSALFTLAYLMSLRLSSGKKSKRIKTLLSSDEYKPFIDALHNEEHVLEKFINLSKGLIDLRNLTPPVPPLNRPPRPDYVVVESMDEFIEVYSAHINVIMMSSSLQRFPVKKQAPVIVCEQKIIDELLQAYQVYFFTENGLLGSPIQERKQESIRFAISLGCLIGTLLDPDAREIAQYKLHDISRVFMRGLLYGDLAYTIEDLEQVFPAIAEIWKKACEAETPAAFFQHLAEIWGKQGLDSKASGQIIVQNTSPDWLHREEVLQGVLCTILMQQNDIMDVIRRSALFFSGMSVEAFEAIPLDEAMKRIGVIEEEEEEDPYNEITDEDLHRIANGNF